MRQVFIVLGSIGVIAIGVVINKVLVSMKEQPEKKGEVLLVRSVKARLIELDTLIKPIPVRGTIIASERVELYSEVTGTLLNTGKAFKVGQHFDKGEVMLALDGGESLLTLKAQRSAFINLMAQSMADIQIDYKDQSDLWKAFLDELSPDKSLPAMPQAETKLKNFLSGRNIYQQYYAIKSLENRQSKFTIAAPFSGTVSMGSVNFGTVIRSGQKIGEFVQEGSFEFEAAIPGSDAFHVRIGDKLILEINGNKITGEIIRLAGTIDAGSQQMNVYARISDERLKQGMYMEGMVYVDQLQNAVTINRNLIAENGYVFTIVDGSLVKKPISVAHRYEQEAYVTGLTSGDILLNQVIEGAFEGMKVNPEMN